MRSWVELSGPDYSVGMRLRTPLLFVSGLALTVATVLPVSGVAQSAPATSHDRAPLAAYSLVTSISQAASGLIARVVLPAGVGCPSLDVTIAKNGGSKNVSKKMSERKAGTTTLDAFSTLLVCEAAMPANAVSASVAGRSIPAAMPTEVDRIALFGDSGCRLKGSDVQDCNVPSQWPLARIATSIIREQADVTIFLGDFFYREEACPVANTALCGGSPAPLPGVSFTDSAWGWVADVLTPMGALLSSTPIVVTRGNHEQCSRGGNGFFLMFDPAFGTSTQCAPTSTGAAPMVYSPTWATDLAIKGGRTLRLVNVDSANGSDSTIDDTIAASQRPLFVQAQALAKRADEAWLLTHRPIMGVQSPEVLPVPPGDLSTWNSVTQAYSSYGLLGPFDLTLSSHVHLVQAVQVPGAPSELVLGNGGTMLDPTTSYAIPEYGPLTSATGQPLAPNVGTLPTADYLKTWVRFGYAVATPKRSGWAFELKDPAGSAFAMCRSKDRLIAC